VLKRFFGTDTTSFSVCSYTLPAGQTCADVSPTLRHFTGFFQAADENAVSRIYVGFHFRDAVETGTRHGARIANRAVNRFLRPVHNGDNDDPAGQIEAQARNRRWLAEHLGL